LPVHSVAEFIDYAKVHPGELSFASSGNGTSVHMSGELFKAMTGINIIHVPYRGSSAAAPDLMTGKVHVMFDNLPGSIEFVRSGQLRALGVTTAKRSDALPDVPAIGETGLRGECLVRNCSAQGHPAGSDRNAEQGGRRGARRSENKGPLGRTRRNTDAHVAGRIWQTRRRRDREMGQGREVCWDFGRVIRKQ
jgi:hypothetical protein